MFDENNQFNNTNDEAPISEKPDSEQTGDNAPSKEDNKTAQNNTEQDTSSEQTPPNGGQYNNYGGYNPYSQNNGNYQYRQNPYTQQSHNPFNGYGQNPQNNPQQNYQSFYNTPPKKTSGNTALIVVLCVVVGLLLLGMVVLGFLGSSGLLSDGSDNFSASSTASDNVGSYITPGGDVQIEDVPQTEATTGDVLSGVQIAEKVTPSIVGVLNYQVNSGSFGGSYYNGTQQNPNAKYTLAGQGSGVIINVNNDDKDHTYIVTNQHVIDGAAYVGVVLYDENGMTSENHYQAEIVGQDSTTDLALLRIEITGLPVAKLANSDQVKKGETVYAIGNPGGLELACSITQGVVSGVNRKLGSTNFIQTDVAVNPGNSGGALVNQYGQVIGIISQKLLTVSTTDAEGLSFAIPTSVAEPILYDLLNHGYVTGRVTLNVTCETVSDMVAYFNNLPNDARVRIASVKEGSAVYNAGLSVDDFIVEFNGVSVIDLEELTVERDKCSAGDTVTMKIYRYSTGKYHTITFIIEEDKGS